MYTRTARFYDDLYHFVDFASVADRLHELIQSCVPGARSLLDVGCGSGRTMELLSSRYEVAGLDLDGDMVAATRERCPGAEVVMADMADFTLGRRFDVVVCLFSSIGYVRTLERMRAATERMTAHLAAGGVLVIEPWFTPEAYWVDRLTVNNFEGDDRRITWMYVSRRRDRLAVLDIHYLIGTAGGVEHLEERHELGLFTVAEHQDALRRNGLRPRWDPVGLRGRGLHVARAG